MFTFDNGRLGNDVSNHQDIQGGYGYHTHHPECQFSRNQDIESLDKERNRANTPICNRPEFNRKFDSTADTEMSEIIPTEFVELNTTLNRPVPHKVGKNHHGQEEDNDSTPDSWITVSLNDDVEKMDRDYLEHLGKKIRKFMDKSFTNTKEDNEFIPGQPWMSLAERRRKDLDITMDQIETSILKHKADAFHIAYDILKHAKTFEIEGRDLAEEIQKALEDTEKSDEKIKKRLQEDD